MTQDPVSKPPTKGTSGDTSAANSLELLVPERITVRLTPEARSALARLMEAAGDANRSRVLCRILCGTPLPDRPTLSLFDAQVATRLPALERVLRNLGINANSIAKEGLQAGRFPPDGDLVRLLLEIKDLLHSLRIVLRNVNAGVKQALAPASVLRRRRGRRPRRPDPLPPIDRSHVPPDDPANGGVGGGV